MKIYLIIALLTFSIYKCNSQNNTDLFNEFAKKFLECGFPVSEKTFEKFNLYANNPCNITKKEFELFIKSNKDNYWKYKMYSKKQLNYFNYVAGLRLIMNDNLVVLIYFRDYSTESYIAGKSETILSIYDKTGKVIASLPIAGGYGDTLTFSSTIYSAEKIEINYKKYIENKELKYSKFYRIGKDGMITSIK